MKNPAFGASLSPVFCVLKKYDFNQKRIHPKAASLLENTVPTTKYNFCALQIIIDVRKYFILDRCI